MNVYDCSGIKKCFICGNIDNKLNKFIGTIINGMKNLEKYVVAPHPKQLEKLEKQHHNGIRSIRRKKSINKTYRMGDDLTDSVVIVNGSNCFGEKELKFYHDKLKVINDVLVDNNSYLFFVRGCDDPNYFENEFINFSNIKTIKDYSVVKLATFNCLCVGGNVSMDRKWKIEQEKRMGKKNYWEKEELEYNEEKLDGIVKQYNIACVITPSSPTFVGLGINSFKNSPWVLDDNSLMKDIRKERVNIDKIYNKLVEYNKKPYIWVYSKFKTSLQNSHNDILFVCLSPNQVFDFNNTVSAYFHNLDLSKPLAENDFSVGDAKNGSYNYNSITTNYTSSLFEFRPPRNPFDDYADDEVEEDDMIEVEEPIDGVEAEEDFIEEDATTSRATLGNITEEVSRIMAELPSIYYTPRVGAITQAEPQVAETTNILRG